MLKDNLNGLAAFILTLVKKSLSTFLTINNLKHIFEFTAEKTAQIKKIVHLQ